MANREAFYKLYPHMRPEVELGAHKISSLKESYSDVEWDYIAKHEGTASRASGEKDTGAGYWPGGSSSGMTVGLGVDLAGKTRHELKKFKPTGDEYERVLKFRPTTYRNKSF